MKKLLYLLLAISLFSCKDEKKDSKKPTAQLTEIRTDLYGSWVGDFIVAERDTTRAEKENYSNKINIVIKKITSKEVIGQSIVAGNKRSLTGVMTKRGDIIHFILKEPGDDKNDGVFNFDIIDNKTISGMWVANNPKKEVTKRKFELTKKEFKYDPDAMLPDEEYSNYIDFENPKEPISDEKVETDTINEDDSEYGSAIYRSASDVIYKVNSSTTRLSESQLKNLKKLDLEILRNTIFARHGFSFKTKTVRQFFDNVEWYIPISTNVDDQLTTIEKQNIALLKRFEKYATDNYDSFGR